MKFTSSQLLMQLAAAATVVCAITPTACNRSPEYSVEPELGRDSAEPSSAALRTLISFNGQPTPTSWLYNPDGSKRWTLPRVNRDEHVVRRYPYSNNVADHDQGPLLTTYRLRHDCEQAAHAYRHSRDTAQSPAEVNAALLAGIAAGRAVDAFGLVHPDLVEYARITDACPDDSWLGCYPLTAAFNGCTGLSATRVY